jgi:SAM-dependent methyltransferase
MARVPVSLESLLIQGAALLPVAIAPGVLGPLYPLAWWQLALAQGATAAVLSMLRRQPLWWPPLHLAFLPLLLLALQADVPPVVYLVAFLLLLAFYWSTCRTRVPLFLSDRKAWQALEPLLPRTRPFRFIDLGSGLGGVPLYLAPRFPNGQFEGTELAPAPWLISRLRARLKGSPVTFVRRDYGTLDLANYDIVFAFLSPAAMPALWQQAQARMRRGSLLVSLAFPVDGRQPDEVVHAARGARHTLYAWRM